MFDVRLCLTVAAHCLHVAHDVRTNHYNAILYSGNRGTGVDPEWPDAHRGYWVFGPVATDCVYIDFCRLEGVGEYRRRQQQVARAAFQPENCLAGSEVPLAKRKQSLQLNINPLLSEAGNGQPFARFLSCTLGSQTG